MSDDGIYGDGDALDMERIEEELKSSEEYKDSIETLKHLPPGS